MSPVPTAARTVAPTVGESAVRGSRIEDTWPLLRRDAVLLRAEDGVVVACGARMARLAGREAHAVLSRLRPHLDGRASLRDLCAALPSATRATVLAIVENLMDRGLVLDLAAGPDRPRLDPAVAIRFDAQLALLAHRGDEPISRFQRFRTTRLLLIGSGPALHAAGVELLRSGLQELVIMGGEPDGAAVAGLLAEAAQLREAGCPTLVRLSTASSPTAFDVVVRVTAQPGTPVGRGEFELRLVVVGHHAVIGEIGSPRPECPGCDPGAATCGGAGPTPVQARMFGGELASQVFCRRTGSAAPGPAVVDLRTMEAVTLVSADRCAGCLVAAARRGLARPATTTTVRDTGFFETVLDYADAVLVHPARPVPPADHVVDWDDQPSVLPTYPDAPLQVLPDPFGPTAPPSVAGELTLAGLGGLLHRAYGVRGRKLRFDSTLLGTDRPRYELAEWRRGTASGGGRYPLRLYVVSPTDVGGLPAGVHHYAPGLHAFERVGDRAAADGAGVASGAAAPGAHLVITARFWADAFKYAQFGYHVATLDTGLLLASLQLLAGDLGVALERRLWFDDQALGRELGLDHHLEVPLAVVDLPLARSASDAAGPAPHEPNGPSQPFERSHRVTRFTAVERLHATTLVGDRPVPRVPRPAPVEVPGAGVALPPVAVVPSADIADLLDRRTTSFGGLSRSPAMSRTALAALLAETARLAAHRGDLAPGPEAWRCTGLSVLALDVRGLARGGYRYDPAAHALQPSTPPPQLARWPQELAQLGRNTINYGLDEVAAVLVVTARLEWALQHYGPRGYRLLNAEAGTVVQAGYLAATAAGIGCGAVLTLDHEQVGRLLALPVGAERAVACLLVGGEVSGHAQVDQRLG